MKVRLWGFFYWNRVYRELVSLWHATATVRELSGTEVRGHGFLCFFSLLDSGTIPGAADGKLSSCLK